MEDWIFDEESGRLLRPERAVQLTPKAAAVLACLIRNTGEAVSVQKILDEVWNIPHVSPGLVREYIFDLRSALGDDAKNPRLIETLRGRGFRLKKKIDVATSDALPARVQPHRPTKPTIAVLKPLVYGETGGDAFATAVASDVINHLSRFQDIGVVARHSSFLSDHATDLRAFMGDVGASYVLELNVGLIAGHVRARVELIDSESSRALWAESYDYAAADMLSAIDSTVEAVVGALTGWNGELHRAEFVRISEMRGEPLNAYENFILGRDLEVVFEEASIGRSLIHLERAVALEPSFGRAWLAYSITLRWAYDVMPGRNESYLARSAEALAVAYKLMPRDPITQGLVALQRAREGDMASALDLLRRAEQTMGTDPDAMICVATCTAVLTDRAEHALWLYDQGVRRNPAPPKWFKVLEARIAFLAGDFDRSVASARAGPPQMSAAIFECLSLVMLNRFAEAVIAHRSLRTNHPDVDFGLFAAQFPISHPAGRDAYDAAVSRFQAFLAKS